jgi:hypothetical protein
MHVLINFLLNSVCLSDYVFFFFFFQYCSMRIKGTFLLFYFVCFILEARGGILVCMLFGFKLHNCRFQDIKLFLLDYNFFAKKLHLYGLYCFHLICFNILQVTWTSKIIDFFLLKNKL